MNALTPEQQTRRVAFLETLLCRATAVWLFAAAAEHGPSLQAKPVTVGAEQSIDMTMLLSIAFWLASSKWPNDPPPLPKMDRFALLLAAYVYEGREMSAAEIRTVLRTEMGGTAS